jgi:hypothetical protein
MTTPSGVAAETNIELAVFADSPDRSRVHEEADKSAMTAELKYCEQTSAWIKVPLRDRCCLCVDLAYDRVRSRVLALTSLVLFIWIIVSIVIFNTFVHEETGFSPVGLGCRSTLILSESLNKAGTLGRDEACLAKSGPLPAFVRNIDTFSWEYVEAMTGVVSYQDVLAKRAHLLTTDGGAAEVFFLLISTLFGVTLLPMYSNSRYFSPFSAPLALTASVYWLYIVLSWRVDCDGASVFLGGAAVPHMQVCTDRLADYARAGRDAHDALKHGSLPALIGSALAGGDAASFLPSTWSSCYLKAACPTSLLSSGHNAMVLFCNTLLAVILTAQISMLAWLSVACLGALRLTPALALVRATLWVARGIEKAAHAAWNVLRTVSGSVFRSVYATACLALRAVCVGEGVMGANKDKGGAQERVDRRLPTR